MTLVGNSGDHTVKLRTSDAVNDEQTINTVEGRLANLNKITKDVDQSEADSEENLDDTTPEGEEEEMGDDGSQDDDQAGGDDESDEPTPDGDDDGKEGQDDKELPQAFLRAAVHRGWKEEDALKLFEENPDAAIRTFQNCYMDVNNASKEWARIGKAKAQADQRHIQADGATPSSTTLDLDKFQRDYDVDEATIADLRKQQEELAALKADTRQTQDSVSVDPNQVLEIENFFSAETLKDYNEFYGTVKLGQDWNDLTSGQRANRMRVLEQADLIILGAEAAQVKMDDLEALERAHMVVSEPIREQAIREGLKKTATKRKKSMMLRPSDGTRSTKKVAETTGNTNGNRDRAALTTAVQEKLNHLFSK